MIAEKFIVLLKNLFYPSYFNTELKMELPQIGVTTFQPEYELSGEDFYGDLPVVQIRAEEFAKQFDKISDVYAKPFGLLGAGKIKDDIDGIDFIFFSKNEFLCNLFFEKKNDVYVLKYAGYKRKSYHDSRRIMEAFCEYVKNLEAENLLDIHTMVLMQVKNSIAQITNGNECSVELQKV